MKKIISLILALSMIFAFTLAFASCGNSNDDGKNTENNENGEPQKPADPNGDDENNENGENIENGENNENTDDQNQNTEPSDPNKITEADWKAFLAITNYTVTQAIKDETTTYKSSGEALEIVSPEDGTTYYVIKDSKTYKVSNGIGTKVNSGLSIGDMVLKGLGDLFADMTYDEENHSYSLTVSSYDPNIKGDYAFYFENGVLLRAAKVKGVIMTSYEFSSYGTTKVEAPDFEIASW